jgi:Domain of unknown function (DUF222)
MDSNVHSPWPPDRLTALETAVDGLAAEDLAGLPDSVRAERILVLRRLLNRLEGRWLQEVAAVDARGAAGAEEGLPAASTASWLRRRLSMGVAAANGCVRTARALFRGPLAGTARALTDGELSVAHAAVLAHGTQDLPAHTTVEAEPVLLEAARRLDPPRLRRVVTHLRLVADPDTAESRAERQHEQRGLWLSPTLEGCWPSTGCWSPRPARSCSRRWSRWPAPATPGTHAAPASDAPTPSPSWPAAAWRVVGYRRPAGSGPSSPSPSTWTASSAAEPPSAARAAGKGRSIPRPAGGWPVTAP